MGSSAHYQWRVGGPLPRLGRHSLAKHRVVDAYLQRYVEHLTRNPAQDRLRLTLVDGFAGGGKYLDQDGTERPGSPLIMLSAMERAQCACAEAREKAFHLDSEFHFVEANRGALDHLDHVLGASPWRARVGHDVYLHSGTFEEHCPAIIEAITRRGRSHRAVFLLDQYGYTDVPFNLIRTILRRLPQAEIILTFATDWLLDYLADTPETHAMLTRLGVPLPVHAMLALKGLTGDRQKIQYILHQHLHEASGARFFTPFFIRSEEAHRDYWLIHLSGHHRARDVMTSLHWSEHNFAHYGGAGLDMLGFRPDRDLPQLGFFFDDAAAERTQAALVDQLPNEIWGLADGVAVDDLYRNLANQMPAGTAQLTDALAALRDYGEVDILGPGGGAKRSTTVGLRDRVRPRRQRGLFGRRLFVAPSDVQRPGPTSAVGSRGR